MGKTLGSSRDASVVFGILLELRLIGVCIFGFVRHNIALHFVIGAFC